ncbi:hypothetical protein [Sporomusa sp. KB1]|jgi:hypothetical protein|nr:hypothetical protein [Sporomusa sp. KB1]
MTMEELFTAYPYAADFFQALPLPVSNGGCIDLIPAEPGVTIC